MSSPLISQHAALCLKSIRRIPSDTWYGHVNAVIGLLVEVSGISKHVCIGSTVHIHTSPEAPLWGEVVGFRGSATLVMGYGNLEGIGPGTRVDVVRNGQSIYPTVEWQGRVINGLGQAVDDKGPLPQGDCGYALKATPPSAHARVRVSQRIDLGIRSLNTFTSCCLGQRMGIFAGSGIGKSILLGQITRMSQCDVVVVGLIGERGREVQEFLQDHLGNEGLKRTVMVVATSDMPALVRRQAAYLTLSIAEYFRDQNQNVLCVIDSVTRFAAAQREIGLSSGEPPTTRGYPPTVFAELPRLLERAGPGTKSQGSITGIFTVLVEGDDHNEPISDAVRSILDGHIVLDRAIAERGIYPAVNILKSISRAMPACNSPEETLLIQKTKQLMSIYEDMAEMIRLGAYRKGSSPEVDEAVRLYPKLVQFLSQQKDESSTFAEGFDALRQILSS
jgi:flagellum-specific ATP synthase